MKIEIEIDKVKIAYLLYCALEGGSNYWMRVVEHKAPTGPVERILFKDETFPNIDFPLSSDGNIKIETVDDQTFVLDLAKIERGINLMSKNHPDHFSMFINGRFDAWTGDVFLQLCFFGEVVYG